MTRHSTGNAKTAFSTASNAVRRFSLLRVWDYPVKEQYGSILMAIDGANPLASASDGFGIVNERLTNDFAFIHDANEIKYEIARFSLRLSFEISFELESFSLPETVISLLSETFLRNSRTPLPYNKAHIYR